MQITNYQLLTDKGSVELPHLACDAVVRVWEVPTEYRANGLFISITKHGDAVEIPACNHGDPIFEQVLPAQTDALLEVARAKKNTQINEWRMEANQSTFTYLGKVFSCDPLARSDMDGVANTINLSGQFPEGFPNAWKAVDNTYLPLSTTTDFINFYKAMADQGSSNFAKSQQLKAQLAKASTVHEIDNINW